MQRISKHKVLHKTAAAPERAPTKSKAAPTKNKATPAAKKTHVAREDSLLPNTIHHIGKDGPYFCGLLTLEAG